MATPLRGLLPSDGTEGTRAVKTPPGYGAVVPAGRIEEATVAKLMTCACGYNFRADSDDELWEKAQAHLAAAHPEMVGKVSRADVLSQAEIV